MKRILLSLLVFPFLATPVAADEIDVGVLGQAQFRDLSEDLSSSLSYKAVAPVEPLGITGFDIGLEVTATKLANPEVLEAAMTSGDAPTTLIVPKLHLHKGLPFGFDLGAFYSSVPSTNITLWGAELRYALVEGGTVTPAVGLRASYSKLSGIDNLEFSSRSADIGISKGFAFFTPYAGVGRVWSNSTPSDLPLEEEEFSQSKVYVGANINLAVLNLGIEGDKTGDATTTSVKLGWRF